MHDSESGLGAEAIGTHCGDRLSGDCASPYLPPTCPGLPDVDGRLDGSGAMILRMGDSMAAGPCSSEWVT